MGNCANFHKKLKNRLDKKDKLPQSLSIDSFVPLNRANSECFLFLNEQNRLNLIDEARKFTEKLKNKDMAMLIEINGRKTIFQRIKILLESEPLSKIKLQNFYSEEFYGYDADVLLFFLLNKNLDDNYIDLYNLVESECESDYIVMLYRCRTKRVLIVQPRECVIIRYIKKISENYFVDVQKTVDEFEIMRDATVKREMMKVKEIPMSIQIKSSIYETMGNACRGVSAMSCDLKSSANLSIMTHFLSSIISKLVSNFSDDINAFYVQKKWEKRERIIWFDDNYDLLLKKFENSIKINETVTHQIESRPQWRKNLNF